MTFENFFVACCTGDLDNVRQGIGTVDLRECITLNNMTMNALMGAVVKNQLEVVRLLAPLSDLQQTDDLGFTVLMRATWSAPIEVVHLLQPGSDVHHRNHRGRNALMLAAMRGDPDVVRAILPGSDLDHTDVNGKTARTLAQEAGCTKVVQALLEHEQNLLRADVRMPLIAATARARL